MGLKILGPARGVWVRFPSPALSKPAPEKGLQTSDLLQNILGIRPKWYGCVPNCAREKLTVTNSSQLEPKLRQIAAPPFNSDYRHFAAAGNGSRLQIHLAQQGLVARVGAQGIKI